MVYSSPERTKVLQLLGWPESSKSLPKATQTLTGDEEHLRGAFMSVVHFEYSKALDCIKPLKSQERILYSVLKSLVDNTSKANISKLCLQLSFSAPCNYSAAIFQFLSSPHDLTKLQEKLLFPDNLALACLFFSDPALKTYIKSLTEHFKQKSDLNGVVLSGFNQTGVEIMENYYHKSSDIQTLGLISIHTKSVIPNVSVKLLDWITLYKSKLNTLELWIFRAKLEIEESKMLRSNRDGLRTSKCIYCNGYLSHQTQNIETWSEKDHGKKYISTCLNCPNSVLCCSVCCLPYCNIGSVSVFDLEKPVVQEDWFVWCECCNHGAHADHLSMWFQENKECPVVGCKCLCEEIR